MSGDGYDEWMNIDPAGRLSANPFRSSATRLEEYCDSFPSIEDEQPGIEPGALRATLYWAVPAFVCAAGAGYLLSNLVGGF